MNFIIDERIKHRIIGVVVLAALAVIFVPALMKKSSQHLDKDIGMRTAIPPRPSLPKVAEVDRQALFKTVKVAHVQIEKASETSKLVQIAKQDTPVIKTASFETGHDFVAPISSQVQTAKVAIPPIKIPPAKTVITVAKKAPLNPPKKVLVNQPKQPMYSVQLAAFVQKENAQILVDSLRKKGFVGNIQKVPGKGVLQYKVTVGKSPRKEQAIKLQHQLAALRFKGFVVSGVG